MEAVAAGGQAGLAGERPPQAIVADLKTAGQALQVEGSGQVLLQGGASGGHQIGIARMGATAMMAIDDLGDQDMQPPDPQGQVAVTGRWPLALVHQLIKQGGENRIKAWRQHWPGPVEQALPFEFTKERPIETQPIFRPVLVVARGVAVADIREDEQHIAPADADPAKVPVNVAAAAIDQVHQGVGTEQTFFDPAAPVEQMATSEQARAVRRGHRRQYRAIRHKVQGLACMVLDAVGIKFSRIQQGKTLPMTATSPVFQPAPIPHQVAMGNRVLPSAAVRLTHLRDSTSAMGDAPTLRRCLAEDGYLLLRGVHERDQVAAARRMLLGHLDRAGRIDRQRPLDQGWALPGAKPDEQTITRSPEFRAVVDGRIMDFFTFLLGRPARTFDFKWLRVVGPGGFTGAHVDAVYMGRGTAEVFTAWTPFGDLGYDQGPLAIIPGSHHLPSFAPIRSTYGQMDVDRDRIEGWFSTDPLELVERFGATWATTEFAMGDVLIFGMQTMHMSLTNNSGRFRLTADCRYQAADLPIDARWIGERPPGHQVSPAPQKSMAQARAEWGI